MIYFVEVSKTLGYMMVEKQVHVHLNEKLTKLHGKSRAFLKKSNVSDYDTSFSVRVFYEFFGKRALSRWFFAMRDSASQTSKTRTIGINVINLMTLTGRYENSHMIPIKDIMAMQIRWPAAGPVCERNQKETTSSLINRAKDKDGKLVSTTILQTVLITAHWNLDRLFETVICSMV